MINALDHYIYNIKKGITSKKLLVPVQSTPNLVSVSTVLLNEGYINGYSYTAQTMYLFLKYHILSNQTQQAAISSIDRISTHKKRVYISYHSFRLSLNGTYIISTSKGICSWKVAIAEKIGGELLCYVY